MSANIKFKNDTTPANPSTGFSSLYVDQVDNRLKRKKSDGSIVDYDAATLAESIEDIIGAILVDTATIDFTYSDATPSISAVVIQTALNISIIPNVPSGNLLSTTVQSALNELQSDIDIINSTSSEVAQDAVASAIAAGTQDGISILYNDPLNSLSFTNLDKGSTAVTNHVAAVDPHTQYLLVNGTRAMSGNLNMGTNSITNIGLVNGVDVLAHASRHLPSGADPLATGTPSSVGTVNATGIANALARQDHIHNHGSQVTPTHHAIVTATDNGFMSAADKSKLDGISGTRIFKAGQIAGVTFLGAPRTATVTFSTVMPNTNYSIHITGANSRSWSYQTKTINGFVINSNANAALTGEVSWTAISNGETVE